MQNTKQKQVLSTYVNSYSLSVSMRYIAHENCQFSKIAEENNTKVEIKFFGFDVCTFWREIYHENSRLIWIVVYILLIYKILTDLKRPGNVSIKNLRVI